MASCPNYSEIEQRTYVKFRIILEIPPKSIYEELVMICGEDSLSYSTVRRWVNLFREGRASVQDAPRPGAPKLAANSDKLSEVKEYVDSFPHSSVVDVANNVAISTGSAHAILKSELELRKVQVRWVPHCLTSPQKAARLQMAKENLTIYERCDPRRLLEIVTGDETWIQFKPPIRKQDGRVWLKKRRGAPSCLCVRLSCPEGLILYIFRWARACSPDHCSQRPNTYWTILIKFLHQSIHRSFLCKAFFVFWSLMAMAPLYSELRQKYQISWNYDFIVTFFIVKIFSFRL